MSKWFCEEMDLDTKVTLPCFIQHSFRRRQRLHEPLHHAVGAGTRPHAQRVVRPIRPPRARESRLVSLTRGPHHLSAMSRVYRSCGRHCLFKCIDSSCVQSMLFHMDVSLLLFTFVYVKTSTTLHPTWRQSQRKNFLLFFELFQLHAFIFSMFFLFLWIKN